MNKTQYVCQHCGWSSPKWMGQCGGCGEWNTLMEETVVKPSSQSQKLTSSAKPIFLSQVNPLSGAKTRISTGIKELDRVLGGETLSGLVPGAVVLLGGSPGIGKSTLLTQVVINLFMDSRRPQADDKKILYVAGEESPEQIYLRIKRIIGNEQNKNDKVKSKIPQVGWQENLAFLASHDVDQIISSIRELKPDLVVVDSIQTITTTDLTGGAGSIGQVRECADRLTNLAKITNTPIFLVGHITKEGKLAGPMVLEHIVDVVLEMSGGNDDQLRLLRTKKNRFGSTDEVGVLKMTERGLAEIDDPSHYFLGDVHQKRIGSAISCVVEGSRPLLVEVQALVVSSKLAFPRRIAQGLSNTKLQLICAILEKYCHLPISECDVYLSLAGGFSSTDPGLDLPAAVAIASSYFNQAIDPLAFLVGEVGLLGEVRIASFANKRSKEAERLGLKSFVKANSDGLNLFAILSTLGLKKSYRH